MTMKDATHRLNKHATYVRLLLLGTASRKEAVTYGQGEAGGGEAELSTLNMKKVHLSSGRYTAAGTRTQCSPNEAAIERTAQIDGLIAFSLRTKLVACNTHEPSTRIWSMTVLERPDSVVKFEQNA